ncbi:MAG: ABC transporter ATP-binding protein [Lachnospiraceae bacterium]
MEPSKLVIDNVATHIKGTKVLTQISFLAASSEVTVILGVNGVGKTTLFRSIAGILPIDSGSVRLDDVDILALSTKERAKLIAYGVQNTGGDVEASVIEFVMSGVTPYLHLFEYGNAQHYKQAEEALEQFDISHLSRRSLQSISGGERQRVYLARSYVQNTKVMLLDEPTTYLDFKAQNLFLDSFTKFVKEKNKIAILSMQDPNLALKYADRIVCLSKGTILDVLMPHKEHFRAEGERCFKALYGAHAGLFFDGDYYVKWSNR